jgi:Methyltransferase domain
MASTPITIDRYITRWMPTVQGYLTSLDARVIRTLLSYQTESDISGHLCEIGVHHGRLFLMLAIARRPGERALGIDLFEDDELNASTEHAGRVRAVIDNARRLGIELADQEIFKTSSTEIGPADILARTTGPVRFCSIDASHLYDDVENDLLLAERTLTPDGIIAVDDFFHPGWPDVSFAVSDFLGRTSAIVPFLITPDKLYLAPVPVAERYKTALIRQPRLAHSELVWVRGKEVLRLKQTLASRGYDFLHNAIARHAARLP